MKPYTSIEQSIKLIEIGIPAESADMYYYDNLPIPEVGYEKEVAEMYSLTDIDYIPCWSLAALLELMQRSINKYDECDRSYKNYHKPFRSYYHCESWIDDVVKTIIWLKKQKHI